jgi:PKD repeat protein
MRKSTYVFFLLCCVVMVGTVSADVLVTPLVHDGITRRTADGTWTSIRNGNGDYNLDSSATVGGAQILATSTTNQYSYNDRGVVVFNATLIPDNAIIDSAYISIYPYDKSNGVGSGALSLIDIKPGDTTNLANGDYQTTTFTRMATDVPYADYALEQWLNISLNAAGLAKISKNNTPFSYAFSTEYDADNTSPTWASAGWTKYFHRTAANTTYKPFITITYHVEPVASFTSNVTSGTPNLAVQFNDTSTNSPTGWNWSYTNVTPGNNTQIWFSQLQNPTYTFGVGNWSIALNASNGAGYNITPNMYWVNVSVYTPIFYYAYGDSITKATTTGGDLAIDGSSSYIIQMRDNHNITAGAAHNIAPTAHTSTQALANISNNYNTENGIYVIEFGVNDNGADPTGGVTSWNNTAANLISMRDYAANNGSRVLISMILLRSTADETNRINGVQQYLQDHNVCYMRTWDALDSNPLNGVLDSYNDTNFIDGVHPNKTGHYLIGEYIWGVLNGSISEVCTNSVVTPVASFTCTKNFLRIPNSVTCTDTSINTPASWSWNMGDGSAAKTTQNVTYAFMKRGIWGITLNATNAQGSNVTAATNVRVVGYENYW